MSQRESQLSRKIMQALRAKGIFCFKVHGGPTMMAGLPDIIACVEGYFIGLETKMPETRHNTSARQLFVHDAIRQSGGKAYVVCSAREALAVIESALDELRTQGDTPTR